MLLKPTPECMHRDGNNSIEPRSNLGRPCAAAAAESRLPASGGAESEVKRKRESLERDS